MDANVRIEVAMSLVALARELVARSSKKDVPALKYVRNGIAYHGSMVGGLTRIEAHTAGAYPNLGDVVFLTPFIGVAAGFGFNGDAFDKWLDSIGIKDWWNFEHSMILDSIERKRDMGRYIDGKGRWTGGAIDLYAECDGEVEEGTRYAKIYVYEVKVGDYIRRDMAKDVCGSEDEFVIAGVDSVPVSGVHEVVIPFRIRKSGRSPLKAICEFVEGSSEFGKLRRDARDNCRFVPSDGGKGFLAFDAKPDRKGVTAYVDTYADDSEIGDFPCEMKFEDAERCIRWLKSNARRIVGLVLA